MDGDTFDPMHVVAASAIAAFLVVLLAGMAALAPSRGLRAFSLSPFDPTLRKLDRSLRKSAFIEGYAETDVGVVGKSGLNAAGAKALCEFEPAKCRTLHNYDVHGNVAHRGGVVVGMPGIVGSAERDAAVPKTTREAGWGDFDGGLHVWNPTTNNHSHLSWSDGTNNISGDLSLDRGLKVANKLEVGGSILVLGEEAVEGRFAAEGPAFFGDSLSVLGPATVKGGLEVSGDVEVEGKLVTRGGIQVCNATKTNCYSLEAGEKAMKIKKGDATVASFDADGDLLNVYPNKDGKEPYFYVNSKAEVGVCSAPGHCQSFGKA